MARTTQSARIDALESRMGRIEGLLTTLVAQTTVPAAIVEPKAPAKPRTTVKRQVVRPTTAEVRVLSKATRAAFVADNAWAKGMSTLAITEAVLEGETVKGGWTLGEARAQRVVTGSWK